MPSYNSTTTTSTTSAVSSHKKKSTSTTATSPLLFSSSAFVSKLVDRGFFFDLDLKQQLEQELNISETVQTTPSSTDNFKFHEMFWQKFAHNQDDEDKIYLASLGKIFCYLDKNNIPYINYLVLFYHFSQNEIRNLYRHYYINWRLFHLQFHKSAPSITKYNFRTPVEFSQLCDNELYEAWLHFLTTLLIEDNSLSTVLFIINKLYQYFIPQ